MFVRYTNIILRLRFFYLTLSFFLNKCLVNEKKMEKAVYIKPVRVEFVYLFPRLTQKFTKRICIPGLDIFSTHI